MNYVVSVSTSSYTGYVSSELGHVVLIKLIVCGYASIIFTITDIATDYPKTIVTIADIAKDYPRTILNITEIAKDRARLVVGHFSLP